MSLPVGTRYDTAWRTLKQSFGQPHTIAEAHIRRLHQKQLKKADALSLAEFSRCLVDAQRTISNLRPFFMNRLNHEDLIVTLMNKLPDDNMKRAWVHKAGDLIKQNNEVKYSEFSEFVQRTAERLDNRFAQSRIRFKVVPVRIRSPKGGKLITTYAFLDNGSDSTLCLDSLVNELGLENKEVNTR